MKVYCKRTLFIKNTNAFTVKGVSYGEEFAIWEKGKYYDARIPEDYEKEVGVYYNIKSEKGLVNGYSIWDPITEKNFRKHFIDVDELREYKLEKILK